MQPKRRAKVIDLSLEVCLPQVQHAKDQESARTADRNCEDVVSKIFRVGRGEVVQSLPTLMLTLPARALPPSTARPVQHACPLMAPSVTHQ
jgi:hypothetical protein